MLCRVNPYWYDPVDDCNDHTQLQPPGVSGRAPRRAGANVTVYASCAPGDSMLPAPAAGLPFETESPIAIGNDCAAATAESVIDYVLVLTPLPDTVNT